MLVLGASGRAADEPLGRLFFTPQQRAALDAGRRIGATKPKAERPPPRRTRAVRLDGIITRSDGERTVWIDGRAYHNTAPAGLDIMPTPDPARARISTRRDRRSVEVRVGQELRAPVGTVSDARHSTPDIQAENERPRASKP
jgi:hypothetical protein